VGETARTGWQSMGEVRGGFSVQAAVDVKGTAEDYSRSIPRPCCVRRLRSTRRVDPKGMLRSVQNGGGGHRALRFEGTRGNGGKNSVEGAFLGVCRTRRLTRAERGCRIDEEDLGTNRCGKYKGAKQPGRVGVGEEHSGKVLGGLPKGQRLGSADKNHHF